MIVLNNYSIKNNNNNNNNKTQNKDLKNSWLKENSHSECFTECTWMLDDKHLLLLH